MLAALAAAIVVVFVLQGHTYTTHVATHALVRTVRPAALPGEEGERAAWRTAAGASERAPTIEGDMSLPGVLQRAAARVARPSTDGRGGRELVLLPVSLSYAHLGLNLLLNLKRLGYAHVLLLAPDERTCRNASAHSPLPTACVWDGRWASDAQLRERARGWESLCGRGDCLSAHEPTASYRTWLSRWLANARLVALGYDTLMLDMDVALLDDVFRYFSQPPLDRYSLLFHSESLNDPFGNVQCGLVYARASAAPGGGTAAAVGGFGLRTLRFLDTVWEAERTQRGPAEPPRPRYAGGPLLGTIPRPPDARAPPGGAGSGGLSGVGVGGLPRAAWAEVRKAGHHFLFDQVHVVDVVQSQLLGINTFRMIRGYDADVHRGGNPAEAGFEALPAGKDGTGSVAVVGRAAAAQYAAQTLAPTPAAATQPAAAAIGREPLSGHRVNELYYRFFAARNLSRVWARRELAGALPDGWARRFALGPEHTAMYEGELTRGWPADCAQLPLEGGRPPLHPVAQGSLAARLLAQLEDDTAERLGGGGARAGLGAQEGRPQDAAPERVALLPTWLVSHWREGIRGGWGVDPPAAIAAHATNAVDKLLVLSAHGLFDRAAYRAAPRSVHAAAFVQSGSVRLVGYDPALYAPPPLGRGSGGKGGRLPLEFDSADEWRAATLQGLPAAAAVSGRVLAYPHVPCGSKWLSRTREPPAGVAWTQASCRTGLCAEWRVAAVGYTSEGEAAARAALRADARTATAAARAQPLPARLPLTCDVHPNMAWPDGPVRWRYGTMCNGHAAYTDGGTPHVGHAFSAWDAEAYAAQLGSGSAPRAGRNVAFAAEAAERRAGRAPAGLLAVSERQLRAELARFGDERIVWLGWPLNVTDPAEGRGRLAQRMRTFCGRHLRAGRGSAALGRELEQPSLVPPREPPDRPV